jgi:hypothetical protein
MKKKTTTRKKPAARPIPPPPPGWEIVGKDDPRLKNLPCKPLVYFSDVGWVISKYELGQKVSAWDKESQTYALPIATQSATPKASPPMIRLRLPSERPTRGDADKEGTIIVFKKTGNTSFPSWMSTLDESVLAWLPGRLPDGILPREPSQEEKWRAEGEKIWLDVSNEMLANDENGSKEVFLRGFLAAKKGGAE